MNELHPDRSSPFRPNSSLINTCHISHSDSVALSVVHLSPLGSQLSFAQHPSTRIENVVDWDSIAKKYRSLFGGETEETGSTHSEADNQSNTSETAVAAPAAPQAQMGNNATNAMMNQV